MIALIDYGMGNLSSVKKAFHAVGANNIKLVTTSSEVYESDAVILPGVGNFGDGAKNLYASGLISSIISTIARGKPFLGICLGMQLLMDFSEEAPGVAGLGVIKGRTIRFDNNLRIKIPQIGWNSVKKINNHPFLDGLKESEYFYFVHSYYVSPDDLSYVAGVTEYGNQFCSCIIKDNLLATQFHPEKSQDAGLKIIKNFVKFIST